MRKKGFTLVELLVVIAIIALLMGILMPALARVKQLAYQMVCGSNLSGLGKAILIYTTDFDDDFPKSGGPIGTWEPAIADWEADNEIDAYDSDPGPGTGTVTSSLYLLVKYTDVTPAQFLCKGDEAIPFILDEQSADLEELNAAWDFGLFVQGTTGHKPSAHVSYSYHQPFGTHTLNALSTAGMAVLADRNPFLASPFTNEATEYGTDEGQFDYVPGSPNPTLEKNGNCLMHQGNGQNVMFNDGSVRFEDRIFCGVNQDNIYAPWDMDVYYTDADLARGLGDEPPDELPDTSEDWAAESRTDSFLVHETDEGAGAPPVL
ncbi:type II secretion system protein [Planctomycetota bacterium]